MLRSPKRRPLRSSRRARLTLLLAFFSVAAVPATADWLVMQGGGKVETRGPWRLQGKLVVFTDASGTLASLRRSEVDLEASRAATAAAAEAARKAGEGGAGEAESAAPAAPTGPVLVLTDADVGHVAPAALEQRRASAATPKVILYSTSWCGYCRKARALLAELEVPFQEKDIEKSAGARQEFDARFGRGSGVPVLDIAGTIIRGFSEGGIRRAVERLKEKTANSRQAARSRATSD